MKKIILIILIILTVIVSGSVFAKGEEDILYRSIIKSFNMAVMEFNTKKNPDQPSIVFDKNETYKINIKKDHVEFTIVDVLKNELKINGKTFHWTNILKLPIKTTWFQLIENAVADEDIEISDFSNLKMDGYSTKILLGTLADFTKNLESTSIVGFSPCVMAECKKERRAKNIQKLVAMASSKADECSAARDIQTEEIDRAKSNNQAEWLPSINDYQFRSVKEFYEKMARKKASDSVSFLADYTNYNDHNYDNCMGVLLSNTLGDNLASNIDMGKASMANIGLGSVAKVQIINQAGEACKTFEVLKDCLRDVKKNVLKINTLKRTIKKSDGNFMPTDKMPDTPILNK